MSEKEIVLSSGKKLVVPAGKQSDKKTKQKPLQFSTKRDVRKVGQRELSIRTEKRGVDEQLEFKYISFTEEMISLSHETAEWYLGLKQFGGERTAQERHVQELYREMSDGNFNAHTVDIVTARLSNESELYGLNGQHTCWAILFMPKDYSIPVRHQHYVLSGMDQMRLLYGMIDRQLGRTDRHVVMAQLVDVPELEGVLPTTIRRLVPGFKLWLFESPWERKKHSPKQVSALVRFHYLDLFRRVAEFYHANYTPIVDRSPVAAALFETFSRKPDVAPEFWRPVFTGLGLTSTKDARFRLHDDLRSFVLKDNEGDSVRVSLSKSKRKRVTTEDLYRLCILAWNKWRAGEEVNVLRVPARRYRAM